MAKLNRTTLAEEIATLNYHLSAKEEYAVLIEHTDTEISHGWENDYNHEYCKQRAIPCHNLQRGGGTIVYSKGNVSVGFIYNNQKYKRFMLVEMCHKLKDYLTAKGLNVEINHNDILVDGYKVASCWGHNYGDGYQWTYELLQISVNQDLEVIKNVCQKPMVKVPKGLGEYGITTDEIVEWCDKWMADNTFE